MKYCYKGHKRTGYKLPFLKRNYTFFLKKCMQPFANKKPSRLL